MTDRFKAGPGEKSIVLAGGCFWGLQKYFDQFEGLKTRTGYANGNCDHPSYRQVCEGSGHAEAIEILYPASLDLARILYAYFAVIDPTLLNRQGNDIGINYRTGIYYTDPEDGRLAEKMLADLQKHYDRPLQVEVLPLQNFFAAEDYHQKYLDVNPGGYCHIPRNLLSGHVLPDMQQVREFFPDL